MSVYQNFEAWDAETEAYTVASMQTEGILLPVVVDQNGNTIEGHQRQRIAELYDLSYKTIVVTVRDEEHARKLADDLNLGRRHMKPQDAKTRRAHRRVLVEHLAGEGKTNVEIADEVGAHEATIRRDRELISESANAESTNKAEGESVTPEQTHPESEVSAPEGEAPKRAAGGQGRNKRYEAKARTEANADERARLAHFAAQHAAEDAATSSSPTRTTKGTNEHV